MKLCIDASGSSIRDGDQEAIYFAESAIVHSSGFTNKTPQELAHLSTFKMASRDTLQSIWKQIENNRVRSSSGHYFVAPVSLTAILTRPAIEKAVAELDCEPQDRRELARAIEKDGMITFAILVWMHAEDTIVEFRRHRCLDDRWPLDEQTVREFAPEFATTFCNEFQWQFRPYSFKRNEDVRIQPTEILPFIEELDGQKTGGFGTVSRMIVYPSLQDFYPLTDAPIVVVRKSLRADAGGTAEGRKTLFDNEKRCLRLLNYPQHPNIVPLLSSYTHDNDYCLLFEPLDMDLETFFCKDSRYGNFQWDFTFFSALHGLSLALNRTHNVHIQMDSDNPAFSAIGYHHDLRPANVLVNKEAFMLADFGMGRVKSEGEVSQTHWKVGAGDYIAPECMDEKFVNQEVGRAVDVWAFGCLMAEVATYIVRGPEGLTEFRNSRMMPGYLKNWYDSYFYDGRGNIKDAVKKWLSFLTTGNGLASVDIPFYELICSLLVPADERPKIANVCTQVGQLNLKAHFFAVFQTLSKVIEEITPNIGPSMKLWFERERLTAFGNVLGLHEGTMKDQVHEFVDHHCSGCVEILLKLFHRLSKITALSEAATVLTSTPVFYPSEEAPHLPVQIVELPLEDKSELWRTLETDTQRLIDELWCFLPAAELRRAEQLWVNSMLTNKDSIDWLNDLERTLRSERSTVYQQGAAMAMMKKMRLELTHNTSTNPDIQGLEILDTDVAKLSIWDGHQLGIYKGEVPVFLETMLYDPTWEKIPPSERTLVMACKAKGFGVNPKPRDLRLLDCLKFFEETGEDRSGYSFVYKIPKVSGMELREPRLTTLLNLLTVSAKQARQEPNMNQPFLGDKFRLASILANFLLEFHTIGWMHENFHSNNVVFFYASSSEDDINPARSEMLLEPFVVGLGKSRPGGQAWHTQGPALETKFLDYQHPDYHKTTMRFRNGYDYYSLGLMLLEIGLWTPLWAWSGKKEYRTHSPHHLRDIIFNRYVPRLGPRMGKVYQEIVELLLTDGIDPSPQVMVPDPESQRVAFNKFFESVAGPLARLADACV